MWGLLLGSTHSYICINAYNKGYMEEEFKNLV